VSAGSGGFVVDVDGEAGFRALVEQSVNVPVVIDLWAEWCGPCKQLSPILERVTNSYGGRVLLAKIDVDKNPSILAAFGTQSIPTVVALVKGQPVPLFQGGLPEAEVRRFFDELLKAAATVGVNGTLTGLPAEEPPLPPLHQAGYEAIERDDLEAAKQAFTKALAEAPGDARAKAALAQVELLQRLKLADADGAADAETDGLDGSKGEGRSGGVDGQPSLAATLRAADSDIAVGDSAKGFNRLLSALPKASPEDKETIRLRLLSLFDVAGPDDPAVAQARRRLAGLLF
jgi:putative thioredoxin